MADFELPPSQQNFAGIYFAALSTLTAKVFNFGSPQLASQKDKKRESNVGQCCLPQTKLKMMEPNVFFLYET